MGLISVLEPESVPQRSVTVGLQPTPLSFGQSFTIGVFPSSRETWKVSVPGPPVPPWTRRSPKGTPTLATFTSVREWRSIPRWEAVLRMWGRPLFRLLLRRHAVARNGREGVPVLRPVEGVRRRAASTGTEPSRLTLALLVPFNYFHHLNFKGQVEGFESWVSCVSSLWKNYVVSPSNPNTTPKTRTLTHSILTSSPLKVTNSEVKSKRVENILTDTRQT